MKKFIWLSLFLCVFQLSVFAADFETATQAVANMKVGWNLGNTLDACNSGLTGKETSIYETCWGQPVTPPELFKVFKDAGFNAIRVPVTWYNHMDKDGKVNVADHVKLSDIIMNK